MAFVLMHNQSPIVMTHEQAVALDHVIRGISPATDKQLRFAANVKKIYFGRQHDVKPAMQERLPYKD